MTNVVLKPKQGQLRLTPEVVKGKTAPILHCTSNNHVPHSLSPLTVKELCAS